jgi:acetylornithine deacetylase
LAYIGQERQTRILVTSHIDTVPPFIPYELRGDQVWGRGSADAKGSVAAQIFAVERLRDAGKIVEGDVALLFVVGEEKDGHGMKAANDLGLAWESVIFGEPTELKLATGHKGGLAFTLSANGKAGHSGYPELGRSAIEILVRGLSALHQLELPGSERFGNTTLNVGQIEGGVAPNVIAQNASATVLVRVASDDLDEIKTRIEKAVSAASPWLDFNYFSNGIGPVHIDSDVKGTYLLIVVVRMH